MINHEVQKHFRRTNHLCYLVVSNWHSYGFNEEHPSI